ncbi:RES domain-containing protein [Psychrobacillus sp. NPDC093180]|uniref:RES domain-containing protein n=1 Tax=Psychrobacillus sp. NPDC093180 TaxID=3364489 RepID=UPI00380B1A0B
MPMNIPFIEIPGNSLLYRIRTIDSSIKCESDLWYPPSEYISKRGRLNEKNEPVLYAAEDIGTALAEMRIEVGQEFYLLFFKVIDPIKLIDISHSKGINSQYKEVEEIVSSFLINEFSVLVTDEENARYRVSNLIGKFFYDYKCKNFDGWRYPSAVRSGEKSTVSILKNAKKKWNFFLLPKGRWIQKLTIL